MNCRTEEDLSFTAVHKEGEPILRIGLALLVAFCQSAFSSAAISGSTNLVSDRLSLVLVVGAAGEDEYGSNFVHQAELWVRAGARADCRPIVIGLDAGNSTNDCERFKHTLELEPKEGPGQLWLVLIGHGTFDGKEARFNLRGPDVSASDLAQWLRAFRRPVIVLDTSACSAPFLNKLSATNRVIVTATRSGHEQYFTRFGQALAEAIGNPQSDLDKDGQVSLLEAFLTASRQTSEFYKTEGRLATEHALLDDNGDGLGTPAEWFSGLRATRAPADKARMDGMWARQLYLIPGEEERSLAPEQRARRDSLERAVFLLRDKKDRMEEDSYYRELEKVLSELARCY